MNRKLIFIFLAFFSCREPVTFKTPLQKAVSYLWSRQAPDGGWHSPVYGIMKGGQAHTPFVLFALMQVPEEVCPLPERQMKKALAFIRSHINEDGVIGLAVPEIPEYPNYATAYALRVLIQNGDPSDRELIERMKQYLIGAQFTENRGIGSENVIYGAWGFGEPDLAPGVAGHVDLSHTRKVLQALQASGYQDSVALKKAIRFLSVLQKTTYPQPDPRHYQQQLAPGEKPLPADGGFYISPLAYNANKGGVEAETDSGTICFRSYATATCDGILALLACGMDKNDSSVTLAVQWLENHPELSYDSGIREDDPEQWRREMNIYHLWVRSEVYRAMGFPEGFSDKISAILYHYQRPDGAFVNPPAGRNKENDPFLATAMGVMALL
ncbi:MAG: prenyltransferase/squalene oxidase repeat-containing protein [Bacteroidia bacterium]